jgi:acetoin utilization deacetylase AcuC-like enzyme
MTTAFIRHRDCLLHDMGQHHPECPDRLHAIEDQLIAAGLVGYLAEHDAPLAARGNLARVHSAEYLDALEAAVPTRGLAHLDPDTAMNPHTLQAALRAAGAAVLATDLVISGEVSNAFCSVRPPGHHAERRRAMGFCFYNNVAVAAAHALEAHLLQRVAVVDFDVHHGNGTEDIFRTTLGCYGVPTSIRSTRSGGRLPERMNIPLAAYSDGGSSRGRTGDWLPALRRSGRRCCSSRPVSTPTARTTWPRCPWWRPTTPG